MVSINQDHPYSVVDREFRRLWLLAVKGKIIDLRKYRAMTSVFLWQFNLSSEMNLK
jgi:hypothetical protein